MKTALTIKINGKLEESFEQALYKDLEKFGEIFCSTVVEQAAPKIKKFADQEIAGYYAEYKPEFYNRTGQMKDKSFTQFVTKGMPYEGGIEINSGNTHHHGGFYPKWGSPEPGISEEQIYTSVWDLGLHGRKGDNHYVRQYNIFDDEGKEFEHRDFGENNHIQGMPHRLDRLVRKVWSADFQNQMIQIGLDKASKQRYSVLKFI